MEYNVIWIDDRCREQTGFASLFISRCEKHEIHLYPFELPIDGLSYLEQNQDQIHAIILDAKGWYDKKNVTTTTRGMYEAIKRIERLSYKKYVPYYILTAQGDLVGDEEFEYSVGKDRVYYKYNPNDVEKLLKQIKEDVNSSSRQQISLYYQDALNLLNSINTDIGNIILDILEAIHHPDTNSNFRPLLYYNQLRQVLEHIFTEANKYLIIPNECFQKEKVNLDQCYRYLIGNDCEVCEVRFGDIGESVVPKHIADMLSMILYLGNIKSHFTKLSERDTHKLEDYLCKEVGKSRYVIFSLTFQICEVIIWMDKYIKSHNDISENVQKCRKLNYPKGIIEPVEGTPDYYHIGNKYCIESSYVEKLGLAGRNVKVIKYIQNPQTQIETIRSYPYLAKRVITQNGSN